MVNVNINVFCLLCTMVYILLVLVVIISMPNFYTNSYCLYGLYLRFRASECNILRF